MIFKGSKSRTVILARLRLATCQTASEGYLRHAVQFCLFVLDFLLDEFFLLLTEVHLVHLDHQFVPGLFFLDFFVFLPRILRLDVRLDALRPFARTIRWLDLLASCWHGLLGHLLLLVLL